MRGWPVWNAVSAVAPSGPLLCTRCCGRTSFPHWRTQTDRTERTRPLQPDTPSCPSTTAGCSTPAATSSTRTADACPPYPGDSKSAGWHTISFHKTHTHHGHSHPPNTSHTLCTNNIAFVCFFTRHILLPHTLTSLPLMLGLAPVCPVQCFQRRSSRQCHRWWQQKVIIIALQYFSAWWWGFGFLSLSFRRVNTT